MRGMLRRTIGTIVAVAVGATHAMAQAQSGTLPLNDLRAPTSPAFVLLDVSPTAIERPQNPKALAFNLISAATSEDGFPRNYALVVAPYWLHSHRDLTFETYQEAKFPQGLLQTFTFPGAIPPFVQ